MHSIAPLSFIASHGCQAFLADGNPQAGATVSLALWQSADAATITARTIDQIEAGTTSYARRIVLLHDSGGDRSATVAALPAWAIPFAARDPLRVIPSLVLGSAVAGAISMVVGAELKVPHGGVFVLPIPNAVLILFVVAVLASLVLNKTVLGRYTFALGSNEEAVRLEALVGRKIRVLRELTCVDESVVPQGTMFFVRARARDRLLAWRPEWGVLLMREEWVSAVPTPPPSKEPVDADESNEDRTPVVPPRWARRAAAVLGAGLDEDPIGDDGT